LINDFEAYSEFLPGCLESSRLPSPEGDFVRGRLAFSLLNKMYLFESRNQILENQVSITQSKGPFTNFNALWTLEVIDKNLTKVEFQAKFTLPFALNIITTQSLVNKVGHKIYSCFFRSIIKMKIYVSTQHDAQISFLELDVSESITASEVLNLSAVKKLYQGQVGFLKVGVNGEELDGKYKALPMNYRMSHGERLEIYKPLFQDPKERRKKKAQLVKKS
jgi:ribosome-associated toxin RatA of RatAB toxin-antitoxin module/putative ubiquitin-RnfH superfamily antitoxin RatB of RatAB toxin-antitoxin module